MSSLSAPFAGPLGGDDDTINPVTGAVDHVTSAQNRLLEQFRTQPNFLALVGILAAQVQELETVDAQLKTLTTINDSFGVQLDNLGALLGEPRNGFDDVVYRLHIQARVFLNKGSGTIPEILTMFTKLLENVAPHLRLEEQTPAAFTLHSEDVALDPTLAPYLAKFLSQARAAGVRSIFHWLNATTAGSFGFADSGGIGFDSGIFSSARDS